MQHTHASQHPVQDSTRDLVEGLNEVVSRAIKEVAKHEGEEERLMSKPIDVLCFGRAGVGKTTLLEALSGRNLGSTPRLGHGTTKLECCTITENLPRNDGGVAQATIRFWDTMGIEKWTGGDDLKMLFDDIKAHDVHPICVLYCATGGGRVNEEVVAYILKYFVARQTAVFYIITNVYNHSKEQLQAQIDGATRIMQCATDTKAKTIEQYVYTFGERSCLVGVNSKPYDGIVGSMPPLNVSTVMDLCTATLNEDQLAKFFVATLNNRSYWDKAHDNLRTVVRRLQTVGINAQGFFERIWSLGQKVRDFMNNLLA